MKSAVFSTNLLGVRCDSLAHLGQLWPRQWLRGLIGNSPCFWQTSKLTYWTGATPPPFDAATGTNTADAETVRVRINFVREMLVKLIRLEVGGDCAPTIWPTDHAAAS